MEYTLATCPIFWDHLIVLKNTFDAPNDPRVNNLEYLPIEGDSGGGVFLQKNGQWQLAGVYSTWVDTEIINNGADYGDEGISMRIASHIDWINDNTFLKSADWLGAVGNWSDANNWSGGVSPNNSSGADFFDVVISSDATRASVASDGNVTIDTFLLGAGNGVGNPLYTLSAGHSLTVEGESRIADGTARIRGVWTNNYRITNDSVIDLEGGTINGSGVVINLNTLSVSGSGQTSTLASEFYNNSLGNVAIIDGASLRINAARIVNDGTFRLDGASSSTQLIIAAPIVTLDGAGKILLSDSDKNVIGTSAANNRLINNGNTISGSGSINVLVTNEAGGVIDANQGTPLILRPNGDFFNDGTLQASNGGTLRFLNGTFYNDNGVIQALDGSFVDFGAGSLVEGGIVRASGTGELLFNGGTVRNTTFDSNGGPAIEVGGGSGGPSTINGGGSTGGTTLVVENGDTLVINGTFRNRGEILLNSTGDVTSLANRSALGAATLTGGGTVTLSDNVNNRIEGLNAGFRGKLTNEDNLIQGAGRIGDNLILINRATIDANATNTLSITGLSGSLNEGVLQASNGATLNIGGFLDNTGGVIQALNGSTVDVAGLDIRNGIIRAESGGLVAVLGGTATDNVLQAVDGGLVTLLGGRLNGTTLLTSGTGAIRNVGTGASLASATVSAGVRLDIANGSRLQINGVIDNRGEILLNSTGDVTSLANRSALGAATLTGGGTVTLSDNVNNRIEGLNAGFRGKLTNEDNLIQGAGRIGDNLILINRATIDANATNTLSITGLSGSLNEGVLQASNGATLNIGGFLDNTGGVIQALNGSTVSVAGGTLLNNSGGTLTGGTYKSISTGDTSTLSLGGGNIASNAADVTLSGANSIFSQIDTLVDNQGSFNVLDGRKFTTAGDFQNSGTTRIAGPGSRMDVSGAYTQTAGNTVLDGAALGAANGLNFQGGFLSGNGTLNGDVTVGAGATVGPGFSPGEIVVLGDFIFDVGATLIIEIGGLAPGTFDKIVVNDGNFSLLGGLTLSFINGFTPNALDIFEFISVDDGFDLIVDLVSDILITGIDPLFDFDLGIGANSVTLTALNDLSGGSDNPTSVPEPSTLVLFGVGLAGLAFARRRKKAANANERLRKHAA